MPSSDGLGRRRASHGAVSLATSDGRAPAVGFREGLGLAGIARRTLGISFLLLTVFLWTLSNFLASFIFSDETYDKPFFLVYFNTSMFALSLIPMFIRYLAQRGVHGLRSDVRRMWAQHRFQDAAASPPTDEEHDRQAHERLLVDERDPATTAMTARAAAMTHAGWSAAATGEKLDFRETAVLSFEFCMLWFMANYLASACLEYTSVASVTILTSTSSVWTLVFGSLFGVETFSLRKLVGVVASLTGIEPFELPPTSQMWAIIIINAVASFVSDISWALAMLLTTPLVVTVGLSLTIPLSLIGEMVQYQQYSSFVYWIGAAVVFVSFVFVNHETKEEDTGKAATGATAVDADDEGVVYGTP